MSTLTPQAMAKLKAYCQGLARANNASPEDFTRNFAIAPPVETTLREQLIHSSDFLKMITFMQVQQLNGQVIDVGTNALSTGRRKSARFTRPVGVTGNKYQLVDTDSGAHLTYELLSSWANAGTEEQFFQLVQKSTIDQFALDILRIGFNGIEAAEETDPIKNPLGEDVNVGWQQLVRERKPENIIEDIVTLDRSGTGADFVSLDAVVTDLIHQCIPLEFREDPRLVVLVGSDLIGADQISMMNRIDSPTEKLAAQMINREIAGRKAFTPPYMPGKRLVVTMLDNLHVYNQIGTQFRRADWIDDRKRFETNWLRNEGFAVGRLELYASYDHVELGLELAEELGEK